MNGLENIMSKLPDSIKKPLMSLPEYLQDSIEEIRIQIEKPVLINAGGREIIINIPEEKISNVTLEIILNNLMNHSIYAYEDELSKGYITIEGGHRVGICGRAVKKENNITLLKEISSINIRRCREITGAAESLMNEIINSSNGLQNTLIVSPPKCGKTTLLRDIARILSYGGYRVGVCDERSEIAGMYCGKPSFDLGIRTDVLDGCPKAEGMLMIIRSMSPDVIITDEIGKSEDIYAIESALCAGVNIITTIHGSTYEDLLASELGSIVKKGVFSRIIFLCNEPCTGTVREVRHV